MWCVCVCVCGLMYNLLQQSNAKATVWMLQKNSLTGEKYCAFKRTEKLDFTKYEWNQVELPYEWKGS